MGAQSGVVQVQAVARGRNERQGMVMKQSAATHLQANVRGKFGRRKVKLMKIREERGTALRDSTEDYVNRKVHCLRTRALAPYSCFGELALVGDRARCVDIIIAERPTELLCVDAASYRDMQAQAHRAGQWTRVTECP